MSDTKKHNILSAAYSIFYTLYQPMSVDISDPINILRPRLIYSVPDRTNHTFF